MSVDVSVLTPSYGYGHFIGDAIDSVLGQNGLEIEHIIQDGGSTDETARVLASYAPAVRYRIEDDAGQSDALNRALGSARGNWIGWLNADEFYLPGALAHLLDVAERSSADVIYADTAFVDEEGHFLRLVPQHRFHQAVLEWYGPYIQSCTVLFRRDILPETPWDPLIQRPMDWDLYLRLAHNGARIVHLPRAVGAFRVHPARITAKPATASDLVDYRRIRERYGIKLDSASRRLRGRLLHVAFKIQDGAYRRQIAGRPLLGRDMRWFRSEAAFGDACELVERCSQTLR